MTKDTDAIRIQKLIQAVVPNKIKLSSVQGDFYRVVSFKRSQGMLSTKGAELTGGRFNFRPPGGNSFPTLYCSQTNFTAIHERFYNLITDRKPLPPHTVACIQVDLARVWDLSSVQLCQQANIDWDELNQPWEYYQDYLQIPSYSQLIGEMAYQEQVEAVMFESTKHSGYPNLAIFSEHLTLDRLNIYDPRNEFSDQ
ncbi:MAG: RES family NAD+ phosphorylase [Cyanobacteria bacterium P01_A01_bin.83]